jgi:hypothetical protein
MSLPSPTLEGFRTAFRRPSLTFAEIAWRWTVGAIAGALFLFGFVEFLNSLPVTNGDATLLGTKQPVLVGRAITHILRGSLSRAALAGLFAALALSLLWIIAASVGRAATVRALLEYFRGDVVSDALSGLPNSPGSFRALIGLNFLRVAASLAALLALVGASILSSFASPHANPQPVLAVLLFMPLAAIICIAWLALNWFLSLACIFSVRDGDDALGALSAAVTLFWKRMGALSAVSTWTGLAHLVAFSVAASAASVPLAFVQVAPARIMMAIVVLLTLGYFAVADWLYIARLAGYVCIAEMPETLVLSASTPVPPLAGPQFSPDPPAQTAVDREERILSDLFFDDLSRGDLSLSDLATPAVET